MSKKSSRSGENLKESLLNSLEKWSKFSLRYWWDCPDRKNLGCFGTGYGGWGVQTNQKFIGAFGVMAAHPEYNKNGLGLSKDEVFDKFLKALRYSFASHKTGDYHCSDMTKWGNSWISVLGIERMMHGVMAMYNHLEDSDKDQLRKMLISEANWLLKEYAIKASKWALSGDNNPESNLWNGSILLRTALMYPDHPNRDKWVEKGNKFLINSISIEKDADDEKTIEGKAIKDWYVGANFFPNFGLDHHAYYNVGYIIICLSNSAMIHYGFKERNAEVSESVYHHVQDLWNHARRFISQEGRLLRIGGDSRIRYCYCQDYLLPTLFFAGDYLKDIYASWLIKQQVEMIIKEQEFNNDGSFLYKRLEKIRENPHYYTRLESDKAVCLSMLLQWDSEKRNNNVAVDKQEGFESSMAGSYFEPEHGAMFHRSKTRFVSWSWRANQLPQGLCLPPNDGHLVEWDENMGGEIKLFGELGLRRKLLRNWQKSFPGGFVTSGEVLDSTDVRIAEGWTGKEGVSHQIAFAALPDNHSAIRLEYAVMPQRRTYLLELKGVKLNIANDLFNDMNREYFYEKGNVKIQGITSEKDVIKLNSMWVNVENKLGCVGIYGADTFSIYRPGKRRGFGESIYYDEICFPCKVGFWDVYGGDVILDTGCMIFSSVDNLWTKAYCRNNEAKQIKTNNGAVRCVLSKDVNGITYIFAANFGEKDKNITISLDNYTNNQARNLVSEKITKIKDGTMDISIPCGQAVIFNME